MTQFDFNFIPNIKIKHHGNPKINNKNQTAPQDVFFTKQFMQFSKDECYSQLK
jgi:hypothetical protein